MTTENEQSPGQSERSAAERQQRVVNWQKVIIAEDPNWDEWRAEVDSRKRGQCVLKVWRSYAGDYRLSITNPDGERWAYMLTSENADDAMREALVTAYAN